MEERGCNRLNRPHETVKHGVNEFVNGMIRTNGMDSHWSTFKRAYIGFYQHVRLKHLDRYSNEFAGRHNAWQ